MEYTVDLSLLIAGEIPRLDISAKLDPPGKGEIPDVEFSAPVEALGSITNAGGYMKLSLTVKAAYSTACARCLKPLSGEFVTSFEKDVAEAGVLQDEDTDDYLIVDNKKLNLSLPVTEQLILDFPSKFLCGENCRGLCPKCGKDLNNGDCNCPKKEIDPRLAPLAKLLDNHK